MNENPPLRDAALPDIGTFHVRQVPAGPMGNCLYVLGNPEARKAFIIDPAWDPVGLYQAAEADGYEVEAVVLTHSHQDHVGGEIFGQMIPGLRELDQHVELAVHVHSLEAARVRELTGIPNERIQTFEDGDQLKLGDASIEILHTPGHSPGSVCFLAGHHLISGDTLFVQACGRTDLPGSNIDDMFYSLQRLSGLPEETRVYPGHNYGPTPTSTIGNERQWNMFMRVPTLEKWQFLMNNL
jgi:glyoxylase-like metal-dependent hydrolase (beta-lactamase superfamily II)